MWWNHTAFARWPLCKVDNGTPRDNTEINACTMDVCGLLTRILMSALRLGRRNDPRFTAIAPYEGSGGRFSACAKSWCGRRESNPHEPFKLCGFSYRLRLSPPGCWMRLPHRGLRSGLSLHPLPHHAGLRCCPSSLYTFPAAFLPGLARDYHANEVSPILSSSASPVSQASTQVP